MPLGVCGGRVDAEHPENRFLLVATVAAGVDTNGRKFAAFAPTFDGESRDTENSGNLRNSQKVGEVIKVKIFLD